MIKLKQLLIQSNQQTPFRTSFEALKSVNQHIMLRIRNDKVMQKHQKLLKSAIEAIMRYSNHGLTGDVINDIVYNVFNKGSMNLQTKTLMRKPAYKEFRYAIYRVAKDPGR